MHPLRIGYSQKYTLKILLVYDAVEAHSCVDTSSDFH